MDITYLTPTSKEFYSDCIAHAVFIKFDRMNDDSWCRITSDKPLQWFIEHVNQITSSQLFVRKHQLRNEDERWNAETHLELDIELREKKSTYLLNIEIDHSFLEYFQNNYSLKTI